jgi:hypothetical protein
VGYHARLSLTFEEKKNHMFLTWKEQCAMGNQHGVEERPVEFNPSWLM